MTGKMTPWVATGEALLVSAHEQRWNMAVVVGAEGKTPEGLVALAFGYSPEGVSRRANVIAAAPELVEVVRMVVEASDLAGFSGPLGDKARALLSRIDCEQAGEVG